MPDPVRRQSHRRAVTWTGRPRQSWAKGVRNRFCFSVPDPLFLFSRDRHVALTPKGCVPETCIIVRVPPGPTTSRRSPRRLRQELSSPVRVFISQPRFRSFLLRKSGTELAGWRGNTPRPPLVAGGALLSGGRASVVPDPVRRHRHRRAVVLSHVLITGGVGRRTSRGRHSAPPAPRGSGATIPGTQRRPGQTHTRARGTIEARPPTRHTPPATKTTKRPLNFHHSGCREAA